MEAVGDLGGLDSYYRNFYRHTRRGSYQGSPLSVRGCFFSLHSHEHWLGQAEHVVIFFERGEYKVEMTPDEMRRSSVIL